MAAGVLLLYEFLDAATLIQAPECTVPKSVLSLDADGHQLTRAKPRCYSISIPLGKGHDKKMPSRSNNEA